MSMGERDDRYPVTMEVRPVGFLARSYDILVDGAHHGSARQRFWGGVVIELEGGELLHLRRKGIFSASWRLELGEGGTVVARAEARGFFRRSYDLIVDGRRGRMEPQRLFSSRRDYVVGHRIMAWTRHRGIFKRGFVVHARPELGQAEMLFFGWVAHIVRQQQQSAAAAG